MSYSDCEALLLAKVQASTVYTSTTATRGDWSVLNTGRSKAYAILVPGDFAREYGSGVMLSRWSTIIELWQRYIDDGTTMTTLQDNAETLINYLDKYRIMGDSVNVVDDATVRSGGAVEEMWMNNADGPSWLRWSIRVEWVEEVQVVYSD